MSGLKLRTSGEGWMGEYLIGVGYGEFPRVHAQWGESISMGGDGRMNGQKGGFQGGSGGGAYCRNVVFPQLGAPSRR